ncbi:HAD family phosphatase [Flavobacteriaceae bacterium]|jgi:2-haloacid dehalogenase|nr:HAD family phosphatase [Flavobacteriaceae bacterium]MDA8763852.1 HAD family phosphatase [Flavobacteriaceae bacterium]
MREIKNIIFDLGGVLIDWNPEYVYLEVFEGDRKKMQWFFDEICTMDWNENQDAGYPLQKATEERVKMFPQYEEWIRMYYGRWEEMLGNSIKGTVDILNHLLRNPNYRVVALTNWSAETFPVALERFEFLHRFEGIVVSGTENTRKPFAEIYQLTLDRFDFMAEESLFIDDNLRNIEAAANLGIHTIHFKNPEDLKLNLLAKAIRL